MKTHYERLREMLNDAMRLRCELFPHPASDLLASLVAVESAINAAMEATPEGQALLYGERVELAALAPKAKWMDGTMASLD